jgi:hypothetical protein
MISLRDRTCPECDTSFHGRVDKKFCSDICRTAFNNRLNSCQNNYIRNINNILKRNRRILTGLNPRGKNRIRLEKLKSLGFNFDYYTSTHRTKDGAQYFYCYDQGYLPIEKDYCLLVVKKDFSAQPLHPKR